MTACPWEHLRYLTTWLHLHRYLCTLSITEKGDRSHGRAEVIIDHPNRALTTGRSTRDRRC
jgi:hypothetical protein